MASTRQVLRSSENVSDEYNRKQPPKNEGPNLNPPKPPRSAFMCFTDAKKKEIMTQRGVRKEDDLLKVVASEWKSLSNSARTHWEEEARNDKIRFVREKAAYKGPWSVPKRRAKKHPLAPKRPMSAFLKYSQTRRAKVKEDNPDMSNTDVSRLLGEMWRNTSPRERAPYVEQEERERALYKENIRKWRDDQARIDAASRTSHQTVQKYHHHHPQPQPQMQQTMPQPLQRPYRSAFFDSIRVDSSFDEPAKKSAFGQYEYNTSNQPYQYHHPYNAPSTEVSLHHGSELGETDLLPLPRDALPSEEDPILDQFAVSRGTFFSENLNMGYYHPRYP